MPFQSKAQAAWMFANKPEMAKEWAGKTKRLKDLPVRKADKPVWDTPDPTKSDKHLSKKKEKSAKARAKAAGRPYPNLIDNMAVSKGARLDKIASSRVGMRYLKDAPLKENEFYTGTTSESAKKIKSEGFRLANPKEKILRSEQQRSKTGRPISSLSNKGHLGPGVYMTRSKYYASTYPQNEGFFSGKDKQKGLKDKSKSVVLRVAVPKNSKWLPSDMGRQGKTPQATRAGYQGVADEYTRFEGNKGSRDVYAFANPKNVKVVNNRYRPTSQAGKDAAVIATLGGAGYGANKVKKEEPASLKISGKLHRIYEDKNGDIVVNHAGSKKQNGKYDKINLSDMAGVKSVKGGVKAATNWHKEHPHTDVKKFDTPAWTRSEGKNPEGGLNAKGRASARAEGHNLKPPVKAGNNPRRASFLARMSGNPGPEHKPNGEPTRLLLSLEKWGASSKADAKKKAAAMSVNKGYISPEMKAYYKLHGTPTREQQLETIRWTQEQLKWMRKHPENIKHMGRTGTPSTFKESGVGKSWEEVSKVFPQPAIYREGSRNTRVMVHYEHSPTLWGIIHPHRGQEVAPKTHITFVKRKVVKKPDDPDLDLFGHPIKKSMEYSVVMNSVNKGLPSAGRAIQAAREKGTYKPTTMTPLRYRIIANEHGKSSARQQAEYFNRGPHESLEAATWLTNESKQNGKRAKQMYKNHLEYANKTRTPSSYKESGVGKSMNQSRFGGASAVGKAEQYDQMGNPVPEKKPLMSGNAKLGTAGGAIGIAGIHRMTSARTLPSRLQGQADAAAHRVQFEENLTNHMNQRVQSAVASGKKRDVRYRQFHADKQLSQLANAKSKQVMADNALAAAPAKKLAHTRSGAGLVATGAAIGGLAAYNNAKERKLKGKL